MTAGAVVPEELGEGSGSDSFFDPATRAAAVSRCLGLLATYFAAAPTWSLERRAAVAGGPSLPDDDQLSRFVRLRVALAAADRLDGIVRNILVRPSFLSFRSAEESVGTLSGHLDVLRYARDHRSRRNVDVPRRYPIRVTRRRHSTPENVAAAYAVAWLHKELNAPFDEIPRDSPESRESLRLGRQLARILQHPVIAEILPEAAAVWRSASLSVLLDKARTRLERGHIASRDTYGELLRWFDGMEIDQLRPTAGSMEWAFYDERFDTKLFELWSLQLLYDELVERLGEPSIPIRPLFARLEGPLAEWKLGGSTIRIFFQGALERLGEARWSYSWPRAATLRGFPDIAVEIERFDGHRVPLLIDPKLRRRSGPPTEEIYKLLGYFGNLGRNDEGRGAIIYHSPGAPKHFRLETAAGGAVLALGVDPLADVEAASEFSRVGELVVASTGLSAEILAQLREARQEVGKDSQELVAQAVQEAAVATMLSARESVPGADFARAEKMTRLTLTDEWDRLSEKTRTMLVTAEYFGSVVPTDADHSGPLLGLTASCERILHESLLDRVRPPDTDRLSRATFGQIVHILADACRERQNTEEGPILRRTIGQLSLDSRALGSLARRLRELNSDYRVPAAHIELIDERTWSDGRALVLGPAGLIAALVAGLVPNP